MSDLFRLDEKIAVIVGGAGGIGKAITLGRSQYGAKPSTMTAGRGSRIQAADYSYRSQAFPKHLSFK